MKKIKFEEYNLLTQRLLKEGYTAEDHPDYVRIPSGCFGPSPLDNLYGGFEYTSQHLSTMVFKTGCGLLVKGSKFSNGFMSYMGIDWTTENDNPVVTCPYRKDTCNMRNPILGDAHGGGLSKIFQCDCHMTDEPYDYERSYEKAHDDEDKEKKRKYDEFSERVKGHVCYWHMQYNDWTGEWKQRYNPLKCARNCQNIGGTCNLTHKPISKKRGNVFYDVRVHHIRHDDTLFDGEEIVEITKGVRLFEKNISITICEQAAKRCVEDIVRKETDRYSAEIYIQGYKVNVSNIRAEQRESRDLAQDLQDIKDGIRIVHESDQHRKRESDKKERRRQAQEKKISKLEKRLLEVGYYNLDEYSLDRVHADKWLGQDRIEELEEQRRQMAREKEEQPVQMNLFDFM